ncbi:MAG TPA: HD-GYP domain-containing protein [Firmicutes bacterium]|nr:HD-GYP domain-containing protein [Bacillota bacterium]
MAKIAHRFHGWVQPPPLWLLLSVTSSSYAIVLLVRGLNLQVLQRDWHGIAFFLLLDTLAEVLYVPLPRGGGVSVSLAVILACAAVYGAPVAAFVAGVSLVVAMMVVAKDAGLARFAVNFGQIAISAYASGVMFVVAGGDLYKATLGRNALAFIAAATTYFLINVTLVVSWLSSITGRSLKALWPDVKYNLISYFALVPLGILVSLIFVNYGIVGSVLFLVPLLLARYSFLQYLNTRNASLTVTQALAAALEAKDAYTKGHSDRVADYAVEVARELGLGEETAENLRLAAEMHDIGKIGITESLLNKPGTLSEAELAEIRKHAIIGSDMVCKIEFLKGVAEIIRYHHEWFDGSGGYPRERMGEEIPLGARILMVCDSFDAMTSDRPYRKSLTVGEAIERLEEGAGRQFDPLVVEAFLRCFNRRIRGPVPVAAGAGT